MKRFLIILSILFLSRVCMSAEEVTFKQTIYIKSTASKVWDALVNPDTVKNYFLCPLKVMGEKKGEKVIYGNKEFDLIVGKIITYKKGTLLSHTFKFLPPGHENTEQDQATTVSYSLTQDQNLVILTLSHTGFKEKNQTYRNVTGGWPYILSNLKTYLETGKTLNE